MQKSALCVVLALAVSSAAACGGSEAGGEHDDGDASSNGTNGPAAQGGTGDGGETSGSDGDGGIGAGGDTVATSFVFVGCNRLQKADWDATTNPSSANLGQLTQTFADIRAMPTHPKYFFFTGDMVLALTAGTTDLSSQLDAWAKVWKGDPLSSAITLVPMPGNHEMLAKDKSGNEVANTGADGLFVQWLGAQGFSAHAGNGPTNAAPNSDALLDDQSKLSYSFDDGANHFVVLNTDTWTSTQDKSTKAAALGWIALTWLTADIGAAQSSAAIKNIFVFGHKPVVSPSGSTAGADAIAPTLTQALETLLDKSSKVRGYFTAHAHLWDSRKLPGSRGVAQIVAGNGGSQLDSAGLLTSQYYGFTEVRIYESGKVSAVSWQRPVPTPYNAGTAQKATPSAEQTITP